MRTRFTPRAYRLAWILACGGAFLFGLVFPYTYVGR